MKLDEKMLSRAAKKYCDVWYDYDSQFSKYISGEHYPVNKRIETLRSFLSHYSIQRNLQPNDKNLNYDTKGVCAGGYNMKKHQIILAELDRFKPSNDWVSDTHRFEKILVKKLSNKVSLLSLSSKVLWQKFRGQRLIYDADARKALNVADKDLQAFNENWHNLYNHNYSQIVVSLDLVLDESPFMSFRYDDYRQDWFYRRILDTYLINLTRSKK
ncbi:hypothetical protein NRZ30_06700 [Aeromonas jandaei]|uniref:hypothetical protein n=1 Tax=Aeromonas jandaei TaxID=650 RepID=UPI00227A1331|nr:hypothetical protein [Aeromonas jandaei]WAG08744.1 hypothetical protein NRZ30_06700 [Aeromonas jandaei]